MPLKLPLAFSVATSGIFDEGDGQWSTFKLGVGSASGSAQNFRVVVSTSSFDTWLPAPYNGGCGNLSIPPTTCASMRGVGLYDGSQSTGYVGNRSTTGRGPLGIETLDIGQLNSQVNTLFGTDYGGIAAEPWEDLLHFTTSTNPSTSQDSSNQVLIFPIQSALYYLASFGVGYGVAQLASQDKINSTLSSMAAAGTIPSLSWGYTAGAYYDNQRLGSLVLGGYDNARINGATTAHFNLTNAKLLVTVSSMIIDYSNGDGPASHIGSFNAVIDSTLPFLILPNATCDWFAEKLGLVFDPPTGLYTMNQSSSDTIKADIASYTIVIGTDTNGALISIPFPYLAFNATANWSWGFDNSQPIFPILRAQSDTAVLGRPFFQEAYVFVDYEREIFNVSQTTSGNPDAQIVSIYNVSTQMQLDHSSGGTKLPPGAIAGIVIGVVLIALLAFLFWWFKFRPGKREGTNGAGEDPPKIEDPLEARTGRERSNTFETMSTAVEELASAGRPGNGRHMSNVSELSTDSEFATKQLRGLDDIHELEDDKTDAAELERIQADTREQDGGLAELEGEGHFMRPSGRG